jgi:hypothetical protein
VIGITEMNTQATCKDNSQEMKKESKLAKRWQARLSEISGNPPKPLTAREAGQLKLLYRGLGVETQKLVDYAIDNWWNFSHEAMYSAGLSSCPNTPHIGFLLAHHDVAMNMMIKAQAKTLHSIAIASGDAEK